MDETQSLITKAAEQLTAGLSFDPDDAREHVIVGGGMVVLLPGWDDQHVAEVGLAWNAAAHSDGAGACWLPAQECAPWLHQRWPEHWLADGSCRCGADT